MLARIVRWVAVPIALALAMTGLSATPSGAITGNFVPDFEHEYVGLIVFYDEDGQFVHRCTGSLISPTVFLTAGHCVTIDDATGELADTLSARHFKVVPEQGAFYAVDLDSTNGTFVNQRRSRAARLASGDVIRAGQVELEFRTYLGGVS
jgi:hypothetical protein